MKGNYCWRFNEEELAIKKNRDSEDDSKKGILDFIYHDYKVIKDEVLQLKNGQIMIITASTSATGLILSFLVNNYCQITDPNFYAELLFFLPLLIIIPSFAICIHKSTLINIKMGYVNCLGHYLSGYKKILIYLGYGNYSTEWYDKYELVMSDENDNLGINNLELFKKSKDGVNKGKRSFHKFIVNCCDILAFKQKYRYWSLIISIYLGLVISCYFFPVVHILQKKGLSIVGDYFIFIIFILLSLLLMSTYAIGKILALSKPYWVIIFIFPYFIFVVFYSLFLKYGDFKINPDYFILLFAAFIIFNFIEQYFEGNIKGLDGVIVGVKEIIKGLIPRKKGSYDSLQSDRIFKILSKSRTTLFLILVNIFIMCWILFNTKVIEIGKEYLPIVYIISLITFSIGLWGFFTIYNMAHGKSKVTKLEKLWEHIISEKNKDYPTLPEFTENNAIIDDEFCNYENENIGYN